MVRERKMKTWNYLAVVLSVMLANAAPLEAQCTFVGQVLPRSINDPYEYVRTVIDSLSLAHQATLGIKNGANPTQLLVELKRARDDHNCAATMVGKFKSSVDKWISATAATGYVSYLTVSQLYQKMASSLTQVLDEESKSQGPPLGQALDQASDLMRDAEKSLEILGQVILQAGGYPLLEWTDQTPEANQTGRLRITESQKRNLMKQIEKEFGLATVRTGPRAGPQPTLEVAAIVLYQWLSDRKRRSADSK
jgi:hypothetical protein